MTRVIYPYSKFWLIFWVIVFLPIGLVLLTHLEVVSRTEIMRWKYTGEQVWLYLWAVIFFPIAILLLILNGQLVKTPIYR